MAPEFTTILRAERRVVERELLNATDRRQEADDVIEHIVEIDSVNL
jgi:hypothetical protein